MKAFLVSTARLTIALLLALGALAAMVFGIAIYRERATARADAVLAKPKQWPKEPLGAIGKGSMQVSTMWQGGRIYYQFKLAGYPSSIAHGRETGETAFTLTFLDENGFKLFDHEIQIGTMVAQIGDDGATTGLEWKGDSFIGADLYRRASKVDVTFTGLQLPKQSR